MMNRRGVFVALSLILALACITGCRSRKQGLTLHFVFEDAKGITVGNKVMGDGVFVGQVIAPPESPKPRHVVVSVRIDSLSPDKMSYVTKDLTATIKKDSLVAGETYLDLVFPREPGETVADGAILKGRGGATDVLDLTGITMPKDPKQLLDMLQTAFVAVDPVMAGSTVFYLNLVSLIVAIVVIIALVLDLLIRLPQSKERERSSPRLFREIWMLFCLILLARVFVGVVRVLGGVGILGQEFLDAVRIGASDVGGLLAQEWPFWVLAIVLITIRFKLDLLMRVRKG